MVNKYETFEDEPRHRLLKRVSWGAIFAGLAVASMDSFKAIYLADIRQVKRM